MRTSKVLHRFTVEDGREIIFRAPAWEDIDVCMDYINSLIEEDLDVLPERNKMTKDEVADWLRRRLEDMEKGRAIDIVAETDGRVIADSEVIRDAAFFQTFFHVGQLGIMIGGGYRNLGLGTHIMKVLIEESRKAGLRVLVLNVFANNSRAIHVYEKVGFREIGRITNGVHRKNKYFDNIMMTLNL
jgi:RimJ/RimL family protein N-acetyltransferase